MERLRRLKLRLRGVYPRRTRKCLQIRIPHRQHHDVARILICILCRLLIGPGAAGAV